MLTMEKYNFTSKFFAYFFNISGIPLKYTKNRKYFIFLKYYYIYSFILLTSSQIMVLGRLNSMIQVSIALVFIFNGIFLNLITLALHVNKINIINIFRLFNLDFIFYSHEDVISTNVRFKRFFLMYGIGYIISYSLSVCSSVVLFPFSKKKLTDIDALLIPCRFPWSVNSVIKYIMTNILIASWLIPLSCPVTLTIIFMFYFMIEVEVQFDILYKSIESQKTFVEISKNSYNNENRQISIEQEMYISFIKCIQHYQKILRLV